MDTIARGGQLAVGVAALVGAAWAQAYGRRWAVIIFAVVALLALDDAATPRRYR